MPISRLAGACCLLCLLASNTLLALRQLSWDALDVDARLDADGVLHVTELQTIVFTGDWNGGERTFNLRPRQQLQFEGMERIASATGAPAPLTLDGALDHVDEYALTNGRTLRWRSRAPSDSPFSNTRISYALHYRLSGILLKEDGRYVLDHDFAFPDRVGDIRRFALRLTLDSAWQPQTQLRDSYTAGPLVPGRSFVLTVPLLYTGSGSPAARDTSRPGPVVAAVAALVGGFVLAVMALLLRERSLGRLEPIRADRVDADWIRRHIVVHPAEVVGAAWDQNVGKEEVVALIARLVAEGKLASAVAPGARGGLLELQLTADRATLEGHERALVDALFFDGGTSTSTNAVKAHYKSTGFDPAEAIAGGLNERVAALLPKGDNPRVQWWPGAYLFGAGAVCLFQEVLASPEVDPAVVIVGSLAAAIAGLGQVPGMLFRRRIDWGIGALLVSLLVPGLGVAGAVWFLWNRVGTGAVEWSLWMIGAVAAFTLSQVLLATTGLKSRNHRAAIVFRKGLATGRRYFQTELAKERPALRDEWYPWIAAFGLTEEADRWAVAHSSHDDRSPGWRGSTTSTASTEDSSSTPAWTGAAGGRSGGAGGGATWATAVAGMAAGVSAPSSSSSGSGSGGSSSSGSSGGGGGGGW